MCNVHCDSRTREVFTLDTSPVAVSTTGRLSSRPSETRWQQRSSTGSQNFLYFFFQAEDGIRDYKVTGVQTCALPILTRPAKVASSACCWRSHRSFVRERAASSAWRSPVQRARSASRPSMSPVVTRRSEERRVGEEGRSRWAPDHLKKKKDRLGMHIGS